MKYPQVVYTFCSSCALNMRLAKSVPVVGVSVALGMIEEACSFFHASPHLVLQLDNEIAVLFQNNEEKGKELNEICHSQWTGKHELLKFYCTNKHLFYVWMIYTVIQILDGMAIQLVELLYSVVQLQILISSLPLLILKMFYLSHEPFVKISKGKPQMSSQQPIA